ncbi:uncharacterized protein VTP21DRAFT_4407 [Calcarisporiella thermophila]|uniref:uncharacterized protein n=1 Tax=Calcarisporiella thermophila TaxID=911321 RepID=UPI00374363AD
MELTYTDPSKFAAIHQTLTSTFLSGLTRELAWRKSQLQEIYRMIDENETALCEALNKDLRRSLHESILSEIVPTKNEAANVCKNLDSWASIERISTPLAYKLDWCQIHRHPKGVVLLVGPWNYPLNLIIIPLIGAIAAGNCVLIKPSEISTHVSALLTHLIEKYLDPSAIRVVNGGPTEMTELLRFKFDHIFYTGNSTVGRIIMRAAAEHLTPVTLELGGKCPVYVSKDADINIAARRIAWGKFFNSGQSCIAPDYILCDKEVEAPLVEALGRALDGFFGGEPKQASKDYARVINERHWDRIAELLEKSNGRVVIGGEKDRNDLFISPTVVIDVQPDDKLMSEEIFGPLLPIVSVTGLQEAITFISSRESPLAIYIFSKSQTIADQIEKNTRAGGVLVNDCLTHFTIHSLPFGGTGSSGFGKYHGRHSFEEFSHHQAYMNRGYSLPVEFSNSLRYPPYSDGKLSLIKMAVAEKLKLGKRPVSKL